MKSSGNGGIINMEDKNRTSAFRLSSKKHYSLFLASLILVAFVYSSILVVSSVSSEGHAVKPTQTYKPHSDRFGGSADFVETARLIAEDEEVSNDFGFSVAISGNTAVVGAYIDNAGGEFSVGSVYIYELTGQNWVQKQEIFPTGGSVSQFFGQSVAIEGDTIVVGAMLDDNQRGTAYVFEKNGSTWEQTQRIVPTNVTNHATFGVSVAISNDTIVIGSSGDAVDQITQRGSAHVFVRDGSNWVLQAKLFADDGGPGHHFGHSVAIDGDTAVVGALLTDFGRGSAYIFDRSGAEWTQADKLIPSDGEKKDQFGDSVDISGDTAIVGSSRNNSGTGAGYIYSKNEGKWTEDQKIVPSKGASGDFAGTSVAIQNDLCLVGALNSNGDEDIPSGVVHTFTRADSVWTQNQKLFSKKETPYEIFGLSADISGRRIVVGSPESGEPRGNNLGSAFVFDAPARNVPFDFDGDSRTDISIFRPGPTPAQWWLLKSSDGGNIAFSFGLGSDKPIPADYTGDGITDIAFFRESTSEWFILRSEDSSFYSFTFGISGDIPVPGDFDGDGNDDVAVYRPSSSTWFIDRSSDGGTDIIGFGSPEDKPIVADYDGDGMEDVAIYRPSNSQWWLNRSTDGVIVYQFGQAGDQTVQGDHTGDGKADVAFWRPTTGEWFVIRSEDQSFYSFPFGANGDIPTPGDYDGDGQIDAAVFRPSTTTWFINGSTSGTQIVGFGLSDDIPLANSFVRE